MTQQYCQIIQETIETLHRCLDESKTAKEQALQTGDFTQWEKAIEDFNNARNEAFRKYSEVVNRLMDEFLQRRENNDEDVSFSIDKEDWLVIVEGNLKYREQENPNIPPLIKIIRGYLDAYSAESIDLPLLERVGWYLFASSAKSINLPQLREVGYLNASSAQSIDLPQLRGVGGSLHASSAKSINLPRLENVGGDFYASSAQSINLLQLREVGNLDASSAKSIDLPRLEKVGGEFNASSAKSIDLPQIQEIGEDLYINPHNKSILQWARGLKERGVLKGDIKDKEGNIIK